MPQIYIMILFGFGLFVTFTRTIHFVHLRNFKASAITLGQMAFMLFNLFVLYAGGFFHTLG